jgi:hypothetical protein
VWAARRLGYADLLALVAGDVEPVVRAELDPALEVPLRRAGVGP